VLKRTSNKLVAGEALVTYSSVFGRLQTNHSMKPKTHIVSSIPTCLILSFRIALAGIPAMSFAKSTWGGNNRTAFNSATASSTLLLSGHLEG
jgi:hypothetical protein